MASQFPGRRFESLPESLPFFPLVDDDILPSGFFTHEQTMNAKPLFPSHVAWIYIIVTFTVFGTIIISAIQNTQLVATHGKIL